MNLWEYVSVLDSPHKRFQNVECSLLPIQNYQGATRQNSLLNSHRLQLQGKRRSNNPENSPLDLDRKPSPRHPIHPQTHNRFQLFKSAYSRSDS